MWQISGNLVNFSLKLQKKYDEKAVKKQWKENTPTIVREVIEVLQNTSDFNSVALEEVVKNYMETKQLGFGQVMPPLRLALVGETKRPSRV